LRLSAGGAARLRNGVAVEQNDIGVRGHDAWVKDMLAKLDAVKAGG
jgi:hypothetical protein